MESMGPFSICCLMAQKREKSGSPAHSCKKIWRKNKVWNEQRDGPFKLKAHTSSRVWHKGGVPKCWSKIRRVFKTSALSFVVCLQDAPTLCAVYTLPARKILLPFYPVLFWKGTVVILNAEQESFQCPSVSWHTELCSPVRTGGMTTTRSRSSGNSHINSASFFPNKVSCLLVVRAFVTEWTMQCQHMKKVTFSVQRRQHLERKR